jgi:hypothetical protein
MLIKLLKLLFNAASGVNGCGAVMGLPRSRWFREHQQWLECWVALQLAPRVQADPNKMLQASLCEIEQGLFCVTYLIRAVNVVELPIFQLAKSAAEASDRIEAVAHLFISRAQDGPEGGGASG